MVAEWLEGSGGEDWTEIGGEGEEEVEGLEVVGGEVVEFEEEVVMVSVVYGCNTFMY